MAALTVAGGDPVADTLAVAVTLRVVATHTVGADHIDVTLMHEAQRWWPGDPDPEWVDTALDTTVLASNNPARPEDVIDGWLAERQLRRLPQPWHHHDDPDLDLYVSGVVVTAVSIPTTTFPR